MRRVEEILQFLWTLAPESMKESWDNVGLLVGDRRQEVSRVLVALDPFESVVREAVERDAQLLVCHHPIFFALKALDGESDPARAARLLVRHGISEISMHTNLDAAPGGVNDVLASALGLQKIGLLHAAGETYGIGRVGEVEPQPLGTFVSFVKAALGCGGLRYADGGKEVRRVAVGGGSCAGLLEDAVRLGCDTFVTADVKYNAFQDAAAAGINLIDAGHYCTENPVCGLLAAKLAAAFPELEVLRSETSRDVVHFA